MHVPGTGVPRRLGVAGSASSPKAAQALGCSLTPGLRISFGRVTCMARAASVPGLWTLGFLLMCGLFVWVWVVLGFGFRLRPATPGWGDEVCVRLRKRSACTPPLLAGLCGVGVCAWARVSAAPRHSWLGCWGLCVVVCPLRLCPATPGWGVRCACVCSGSVSGCAPPLLAGVMRCVCVCVRAPLVPRHSWLGCEVWVCVLGLEFRLQGATPGWGVGVCVCLCALSTCTPPLLAGVCGVGVCAWALVLAVPRHPWLGCWGVCVRLRAPRLYPATPGWGVRCVCVCFGLSFGCAPPLVAGVTGCVCVGVRAPLVPRNSWLGCAAWVCVLGLGFGLRPATPGWGVGMCVFVCALPTCTPPLLARVCGVCICAWARYLAAPRLSWLRCWGVCVCVRAPHLYPATPGSRVRCVYVCLGSVFGCAPPLLADVWGCACFCARSSCTPPLLPGVCGAGVCAWAWVSAAPCHSWLGFAVCVCLLGLGFRLHPATPCWGIGVCVCLCARSA